MKTIEVEINDKFKITSPESSGIESDNNCHDNNKNWISKDINEENIEMFKSFSKYNLDNLKKNDFKNKNNKKL